MRRRGLFITLGLAALGGVFFTPAQAQASAGSTHRQSAVVSLGDSYIAGEAGRWKGNSADPQPGHAGTDRAFADGTTDPARVYGSTAGTCDRSDVAPIISARLPFVRPINLACSGAKTVNVLRASAGGVGYQGELPQNDQLAAVASNYRVRLITLSIGGNDLGFSPILQSCIGAYLSPATIKPCSTTQQPAVDAAIPLVQARIEAVIDDVRATMATAGYRPGSYRFILQSYPSPLAPASEFRYPGPERASVGGCPISDVDADWTAKSLVPQITQMQSEAAASKGLQFLDLEQAVRGHQLCSKDAAQSTGTPTAAASEWIRFIDLFGQGSTSESLHPNYYGQAAVGRCLAVAALVGRDASCAATPGQGIRGVHLRFA